MVREGRQEDGVRMKALAWAAMFALLLASALAVESHYEILLSKEGGNVTVDHILVRPTLTTLPPSSGGHEAMLLDIAGNRITTKRFSFKTQLLYDAYELNQSGNVYGPEERKAQGFVRLPYSPEAALLRVLDENGTVVLEADLTPYAAPEVYRAAKGEAPPAPAPSTDASGAASRDDGKTGRYALYGLIAAALVVVASILIRRSRRPIQT
jgi:hypothetical protein